MDEQRAVADRALELAERWIVGLRERTEALVRLLGSFDPAAVVRRGYAVVRDASGRVRVSVKGLTAGDPLSVGLRDGTAKTVVESVYAKKEGRV
jgi:exodeoxyribonuclease VII large subunit